MTFALDVDITAAPAEVFDFVADFASTPRWYAAVQHVERVHGDGGVGTRYAVHRRLPAGPVVNTVEITRYVAETDVTFTSIEGPTPFTYRYHVRPIPSGTRLRLEGAISAAGLPVPARLLGPMAERLFAHGMKNNLDILKRILEHR